MLLLVRETYDSFAGAWPFLPALADPAADLALVGGNGASLARLAGAGLPVPPGFQVTTLAYRTFVEHNGLQLPRRPR